MRTINDIPKYFKIGNQQYKVVIVDHLANRNFGEFDSVKAEIRIAKKVESGYTGELVDLQEEQILNTWYHELFHCFNWHMNCETSEELAQSFANFMREYETTRDN